MKRIPLRIALVLLGLLAVAWWQSTGNAPPAPGPAVEKANPAPAAVQPPAPAPPVTPDAARAAAERYDLRVDEERGGHTIARHVGKTDAELFQRLDRERGISAASTYSDLDAAERTVARTLAAAGQRLDAWLARQGSRPNLALDYAGRPGEAIGRSVKRGRKDVVTCTRAVVVLRWTRGREFYVLTSYPEAGR